MGRRYTTRKDGSRMTTVALKLHVDETLVDFVAERRGMSRAEALEEVVDLVRSTLDRDIALRRRVAVTTDFDGQKRVEFVLNADDAPGEAEVFDRSGLRLSR